MRAKPANRADGRGEDRQHAEAVQEGPQDAARDHRDGVGAPTHPHQARSRVHRRLDAHSQEAQGDDDDSPLVQHRRALARDGAIEPACDGAQESLAAAGQDRARGGPAREPVGQLRAHEDDHEEEREEPDALASKGGDHAVDSCAEHNTLRRWLTKRSLS